MKKMCIIVFCILIITGCSKNKINDSITSGNIITSCGIELSSEQYENLSYIFDKDIICDLSEKMLNSTIDDRTICGIFEYKIDTRLFDDSIERYDANIIEGSEISRDEAISLAKDRTSIKYDTIKVFTDKVGKMWKIMFYMNEDKLNSPLDYKYQYIYIDYLGNINGIANVSADMELQTFSEDTGKPYFTNVNNVEFTTEEFTNLMYTFKYEEIVFMEKKVADKYKNDKERFIPFNYDTDIKTNKSKLIKNNTPTKFDEVLDRVSIINSSIQYISSESNISTNEIRVYFDTDSEMWKVQFGYDESTDIVDVVYLDKCGNILFSGTISVR